MTAFNGSGGRMRKKKTIDIPIESDERTADGSAAEEHEVVDAGPAETAEAAIPDDPAATWIAQLQRLQAEFDNYRKRTDRERLETGARAQADLVDRILPVLDDLDRAADSVADPESSLVKGFLLVRDKLHRILGEAGLERIAAVGADFDPNLHEALLTEPVEADRAGKVLDELVAGYRYQGRVVRPARVKVGMEGGE